LPNVVTTKISLNNCRCLCFCHITGCRWWWLGSWILHFTTVLPLLDDKLCMFFRYCSSICDFRASWTVKINGIWLFLADNLGHFQCMKSYFPSQK
jgi:hypothetical protein